MSNGKKGADKLTGTVTVRRECLSATSILRHWNRPYKLPVKCELIEQIRRPWCDDLLHTSWLLIIVIAHNTTDLTKPVIRITSPLQLIIGFVIELLPQKNAHEQNNKLLHNSATPIIEVYQGLPSNGAARRRLLSRHYIIVNNRSIMLVINVALQYIYHMPLHHIYSILVALYKQLVSEALLIGIHMMNDEAMWGISDQKPNKTMFCWMILQLQ